MASGTSRLSAKERREALKGVFERAGSCVRCPQLAQTRKSVVFGAGNADADLMFIGEAPGASEDERGLPFVGRAGQLLDQLLAEIGFERGDVFIANVLKCRPPGNRDPLPVEIDNCREYLESQVELIQPRVICALGNYSTKLLRGDPTGITRLHGQPEVITLGRRAVRLYPIYHPAAALYTPRMLETLREDMRKLPGLLALPEPEQPSEQDLLAGPGDVPELDEPERSRTRRSLPRRTSSACSRIGIAPAAPPSPAGWCAVNQLQSEWLWVYVSSRPPAPLRRNRWAPSSPNACAWGT